MALDVSDNAIQKIIGAIENDHPVILAVDGYYLSIRIDTFNKTHLSHAILIHGYDRDLQIFHIVEHRYQNSFIYEKRTIPFEDIVNSCENIIQTLNRDPEFPICLEYYLTKGIENASGIDKYKNDSVAAYKVAQIENIPNRLASLNQLTSFRNFMSSFILNEKTAKQYLDQDFNIFTNIAELTGIINNHQYEKYRINRFFKQSAEPIKAIEMLINNWQIIRAAFFKYKSSGVYIRSSFQFALQKLIEIDQVERPLLNLFYSLFDGREE